MCISGADANRFCEFSHIHKSRTPSLSPLICLACNQDRIGRDRDYGAQKSTVKKDDLNPEYGETFHFNIPTLNNMELTCTVKDDDVGKDEELGKCKIKLEKLDLTETPTEVEKKVDNRLVRKDAKIFLKLSWQE